MARGHRDPLETIGHLRLERAVGRRRREIPVEEQHLGGRLPAHAFGGHSVLLRQRLARLRQPEVPRDEVVGEGDVRALDLIDRLASDVAALHAVDDQRVVRRAVEEVGHRHLHLEPLGQTIEGVVDGGVATHARPDFGAR